MTPPFRHPQTSRLNEDLPGSCWRRSRRSPQEVTKEVLQAFRPRPPSPSFIMFLQPSSPPSTAASGVRRSFLSCAYSGQFRCKKTEFPAVNCTDLQNFLRSWTVSIWLVFIWLLHHYNFFFNTSDWPGEVDTVKYVCEESCPAVNSQNEKLPLVHFWLFKSSLRQTSTQA